MPQRLLFVYNADTGLLPGVLDLLHKALSPGTYPCSLCAVTHGLTEMRPEWKEFVRTLPVPVDFLHRDEFVHAYPQWRSQRLPAAFRQAETGELTPFIQAEEMNSANLDGLMEMVRSRLV